MEHSRYDLAFEIGDRILRVQCKWGGLYDDGAVIKVNLTSSWCTPRGYTYRRYEENEIDLVAVYCGGSRPLLPSAARARGRSAHDLPTGDAAEEWPEGMHSILRLILNFLGL